MFQTLAMEHVLTITFSPVCYMLHDV